MEVRIADVLAVRTTGMFARLIRLAEALEDEPNTCNHIAVVHHFDPQGRPWVIAGQPGGVGEADARLLISDRWTVNNCGQPGRTTAARQRVAQRAAAMLGTPYDWEAIEDDAIRAFAPYAKEIWDRDWTSPAGRQLAPGHVVCSSFAAYLYDQEGWDHPEQVKDREITPGDWAQFMIEHGYSEALS
jgi:hypothetical protein